MTTTNQGMLIVIEGMDGSGKNTQARILEQRLKDAGKKAKLISFPNYKAESSYMVRQYLGGKIPNDKNLVGDLEYVKQVSSFYTVDRIATFHQADEIEGISPYQMLQEGWILICDRYTSSNILHQTANVPPDKIFDYMDWIRQAEHIHFGLPRPDFVFYLQIPLADSLSAVREANAKKVAEGAIVGDIHENFDHLYKVTRLSNTIINYNNWTSIKCLTKDGERLNPQEVSDQIFEYLTDI